MSNLTGIASLSDGYETEEESIDTQKQLVTRVLKQVSAEDLMTVPIELLHIDWEKIKCGAMTKTQLKSTWEGILSKERLYRTGGDILLSFMENPHKQCNPTVKNWNQRYLSRMNSSNSSDVWAEVKKVEETAPQENNLLMLKDKKNLTAKEKKELKEELKKYPSKPKTGYQLFVQEKLKTHKMGEISALWKALDDQEYAHYFNTATELAEEYLKKLEKFLQEHPDDDYAKDLHKKFLKTHSKPKNAKRTNTNDETVVSTPSKNKKKKVETPKKEWTGFDVFAEKKKDELTVENPDMDEEEILQKLKKKYEKMSDIRKEKYEKLAEEMNEEG